jgi:hypothetical protein
VFTKKYNWDCHVNKRKTPCVSKVKQQFKCEMCHKDFVNKSNLNKHVKENCKKIKLDDNFENLWDCYICGESLINKMELDEHLEVCFISKDKDCKTNMFSDDWNLNVKRKKRGENIYKFDTKTYGCNIYKDCVNSGDIYIMQTEFGISNLYNIECCQNICKQIKKYCYKSRYDPKLYYYFPCKDIKKADPLLREKLKEYQIKIGSYRHNLDDLKQIVEKCQKIINDNELECFVPEIKKDKEEMGECGYCKNIFFTKQDLDIHINSCPKKKIVDEEKEQIFKRLIKENKKLKKENNMLHSSVSIDNTTTTNSHNITNSHNTTNTTNNTQNNFNIQLVAFGKEDLSYIDDKTCKEILERGYLSIPELIEYVHFNKNDPKHHNVYIANMRDVHAMTFDGKTWILTDKQETIDTLYDEKYFFLSEKFQELKSSLKDSTVKKFSRFSKDESKKVKKDINDEIKRMLYNKREIPTKSRKMLDNNKLLEFE